MKSLRPIVAGALLVALAMPCGLRAQTAAAAAQPAAAPAPPVTRPWVARSNANADYAVGVLARFQPEGAGQLGVTSVDSQVLDLTAGYRERARKANGEVIAELGRRLAAENDPLVRQDLEIMAEAFRDNQAQSQLNETYFVSYVNVPQLVFFGLRSLLDDQIPKERRAAALARLRE